MPWASHCFVCMDSAFLAACAVTTFSTFLIPCLIYMNASPGSPARAPKRSREEDASEHKRARVDLASLMKQIVVLTGRYSDTDDCAPLVKYWNPACCANTDLRKRIADQVSRGMEDWLLYYLLTGENPDEMVGLDFLEYSPTELGVCEFPRVICCDLDF